MAELMSAIVRLLLGIGIITSFALSAQPCSAKKETNTWKYLNVAKLLDSTQYRLSVDSRGLPHMVLLSQTCDGKSFTYVFWSKTGWTKSAIQPVDSYIPNFTMFLDSNDSPHIFFIESRLKEETDLLRLATLDKGAWHFQTIAKHARISNLQALPSANGSTALIYDFSENLRYNEHTILAITRVRNETIDVKTIPFDESAPLHRSLATDSRNHMFIAYTQTIKDGYQEIDFLIHDGNKGTVKSIVNGNYDDFSHIILSQSAIPCIYAFNFDRDGIERFCISADRVDRTLIPDTKDGQLPYIAMDSADQAHIAYVDFRRLAYGKQELRYVRQHSDMWEHQTVDYGMNANIELRLDKSDNAHLLYQVSDQLKYATTSRAIENPGKAAGKPERATPDLVFDKLPITPKAALALIHSLKQVKKDAKWADKLELESYPSIAHPFYHFHQYTVMQVDATTGQTATAGWYNVNAYTGRVTDAEDRVLIKGKKKHAKSRNGREKKKRQ